MTSPWDPERLRIVGSVMTRYSEHLAPGHRIRLGMEGDPCADTYRAADDAPAATVLEVIKRGDTVEFTARRDDTGETIHRNNTSVAPNDLWEIHPDFVDAYRAHVNRADEEEDEDRYTGGGAAELKELQRRVETLESVRDEYRSSSTSLSSQFEEAEATNRAFRETMASTVRALAGDLMRAARGETIEFAHQYADRYDLAIAERASYRGAKEEEEEDAGEREARNYQGEKYAFEESSQLSDDP